MCVRARARALTSNRDHDAVSPFSLPRVLSRAILPAALLDRLTDRLEAPADGFLLEVADRYATGEYNDVPFSPENERESVRKLGTIERVIRQIGKSELTARDDSNLTSPRLGRGESERVYKVHMRDRSAILNTRYPIINRGTFQLRSRDTERFDAAKYRRKRKDKVFRLAFTGIADGTFRRQMSSSE